MRIFPYARVQVRRSPAAVPRAQGGLSDVMCSLTLFKWLSSVCSKAANSTTTSGYLGGIGTDAAFNPRSTLYDAQLLPEEYYNTSKGSGHISPAGMPYG